MKKLLLFLFLFLFLCSCATTIEGPSYDEGRDFGEMGYPSITYWYKGVPYRWYNTQKSFKDMHMDYYKCKDRYFDPPKPEKSKDLQILDVNNCMERRGYTQTRPDLLDVPMVP